MAALPPRPWSTPRALAAAALLAVPAASWAHALLVRSTPSDGAVLATAPGAAQLVFNSRIEKRLTRATLAHGQREVPLAPGAGQDGEPPNQITIPLPELRPGEYRLTYRVMAADGHTTPGVLRFTLRAGGEDGAGAVPDR